MSRTIKGTVHNRHIELEEAPGVPSGTPVTVVIEPRKLSIAERRRVVEATSGAWADDPSIGPIFDRISAERLKNHGRRVSFD